MANNRLYLIHKPSGERVLLGKRMAWGWYDHGNLSERIEKFFNEAIGDCKTSAEQDDFELELEHPAGF